ncbi:MAG: insulinase family protein [Bacillota bacterium]|nr:MAG: insulinase family protein [Bacillota bacterium]
MLPGGLEAWVWRRKGFYNRHASFAARFGAMDALFEADGRVWEVPDGTAHFLEHMAFETSKGSALGLFSRLGVRANAFTSHTSTAYYFSGTDNFWPALRQLVELVVTSRLTPKGVDDERRVISQEIRMYEDSPEAKVFEELLAAMYRSHPIRRRIAGTLDSVASVTPDTLLRCHRTFYHPSNLVFVAAGDVEPCRVFDTVAAELVRLGADRPGPGLRRLYPDEPALPARPRVSRAMPVKRPSFLVGFKDSPVGSGSPHDASFGREITLNLVVEALLGPASGLYDSLYRDGLVDDSFSARYTCGSGFGHVVAGGTTRDAEVSSERLLEGISRLRPKGIERADFERKRRKALGQFLGLFDSLEGLATLLIIYRMRGIDLLEYPRVLGALAAEEAERTFQELFRPEQACVSAVVPGE